MMVKPFHDEMEFTLKSIFFWIGVAVITAICFIANTQKTFSGVLDFYQFSFNSQFFTFLVAIMALIYAYISSIKSYETSGFPTKSDYRKKLAANIIVFSLVLLFVTLPRFIILEMYNGAFTDLSVTLYYLKCFFIYYFFQGVFFIVFASIAGRSFYVLFKSMPITMILTLAYSAILLPICAGYYSEFIHSFIENKLSGIYHAAVIDTEIAIKLTPKVILLGLGSLLMILAVIIVIVSFTYHVYNRDYEKFQDYHPAPEK